VLQSPFFISAFFANLHYPCIMKCEKWELTVFATHTHPVVFWIVKYFHAYFPIKVVLIDHCMHSKLQLSDGV
jgi:hypothetical protein